MRNRILTIIKETLSLEKLPNLADNFKDDLHADSLDMVELTMALEEEFGIKVSDDEATGIETVLDAIKIIEEKTL